MTREARWTHAEHRRPEPLLGVRLRALALGVLLGVALTLAVLTVVEAYT